MSPDEIRIMADAITNGRTVLLDGVRLHDVLLATAAACQRGDVAQFGVGFGGSAILMAMMLKLCRSPHKLFLFENWAGLPTPRKEDGDYPKQGWFLESKDKVVDALTRAGLIQYVEFRDGDVLDTVQSCPKLTFAHVDLDLYAGTYNVLHAIYDRVDGAIIVDDYASTYWPGVTAAVNEFLARFPAWKLTIRQGNPDIAALLECENATR